MGPALAFIWREEVFPLSWHYITVSVQLWYNVRVSYLIINMYRSLICIDHYKTCNKKEHYNTFVQQLRCRGLWYQWRRISIMFTKETHIDKIAPIYQLQEKDSAIVKVIAKEESCQKTCSTKFFQCFWVFHLLWDQPPAIFWQCCILLWVVQLIFKVRQKDGPCSSPFHLIFTLNDSALIRGFHPQAQSTIIANPLVHK